MSRREDLWDMPPIKNNMNGNVLISICLILMGAILFCRRKRYGISAWLVFPLIICTAGMGLLGTYILFYLENGFWYGKSFFGAVLFFPVLLLPVSWIFRIDLQRLLSYATVPGVALLAVYKYNCYLLGCCGGKTLWFTENGIPIHFPSQIVEMITAVLITVLLLVLERRETLRKMIYPICLVVYGCVRAILTYFRWDQPSFIFGLAPGVFWSVISVIIGAVWILLSICVKKKSKIQ